MKSKIQGALLGVMLGDSLGMPVETMTRSEIVRALGPNGVTGFMDPKQTRVDDTKDMRAGDTTDDWQGNKIVLGSLIAQKSYDADHMIGAHCAGMQESTFGWGKGSVHSIQMIIDGKRSGHIAPAKEKGTGLGNGVMMKIPALALYHSLLLRTGRIENLKTFAEQTRRLGVITHSDPRAWITAYAVGALIIDRASNAAEDNPLSDSFLLLLARDVDLMERCFVDTVFDRTLAQALRELPHHLGSSEQLVERFGCRFVATQTMPLVIGTYLRHQRDFRAGVLEAVNAGGDTDTNAAIVGAMIGATVGLEGIPHEWRTFRPEFEEAIVLGEQLYDKIA